MPTVSGESSKGTFAVHFCSVGSAFSGFFGLCWLEGQSLCCQRGQLARNGASAECGVWSFESFFEVFCCVSCVNSCIAKPYTASICKPCENFEFRLFFSTDVLGTVPPVTPLGMNTRLQPKPYFWMLCGILANSVCMSRIRLSRESQPRNLAISSAQS